MEKNPVVVIADPETHDFYRTLPLWDERIDIYPAAGSPHRGLPLRADLVLIDCGFDDERGLCLLRELKVCNPEVPVMFVTNAGSEETAVSALRCGARDYIKKPVDLLEFRNNISQFLATKRAAFWGKRRRYLAAGVADAGHDADDLPANLLRAMRFVKENFARPLSLDQIAQEGGLSKCHFCREFKKSTGMTPMLFLARMRIKRSKELLRRNIPVSAIAMKVGFNDLSSFNRHFKRFVGLTPTSFRDSLRKDA